MTRKYGFGRGNRGVCAQALPRNSDAIGPGPTSQRSDDGLRASIVGWDDDLKRQGGLRLTSHLRIYALDSELDLGPDATRGDLLRAMEGHILADGELNGEYAKKRNF